MNNKILLAAGIFLLAALPGRGFADTVSIGEDGINVTTGAGQDIHVGNGMRIGNGGPQRHSPGGTGFAGATLRNETFSDAHMQNFDFTGAVLENVVFRDTYLQGAKFGGATLINVQFIDTYLESACFSGAKAQNVLFQDSYLANSNFVNVERSGITMRDSYMTGMSWTGAPACTERLSQNTSPQQPPARPEITQAAAITQSLKAGKDAQIDLTVNFEFDSDKIQGTAHKQIFEIAQALKSDQLRGRRIMIEGHTDSKGEDQYNIDLSYRRAVRVMRVLSEEYGIESARISVSGMGEKSPVASNEQDWGRALNRRVTLVDLG